MYCPRLDHFVRFNPNGSVSRCGHMVNPPEFESLDSMNSSHWLETVKQTMAQDHWPSECVRCQQTESINGTSIRLNTTAAYKQYNVKDFIVVGGVLDNICNSACQFCSEGYSTKIGSLKSRTYPIVDNSNKFWSLPQDRIVHLDLNGGEPSASKNYKQVLANLPPNVKSVRLNTNCSIVLDELLLVASRGIEVTVTVSFDGIGLVHDYLRWPIKWDKFLLNLMTYKSMPINLNLWTTVNALNVRNMPQVFEFVKQHNFNHSWALLDSPSELNIQYSNHLTTAALGLSPEFESVLATKENNQQALDAYIAQQDQLRGISINDYVL